LIERLARLEHRLYFSVNFARIDELVDGYLAKCQKGNWSKAELASGQVPKGHFVLNLKEDLKNNKIRDKIRVAPPQEALELAQLLSDKIFENIPERTPPTQPQLLGWAYEAERIYRIDGHPWDKIRELLLWSQRDDFWRANILSMSKFRKQWNQLMAKANGTDQTKADRLRRQTAEALKRGMP
jgi:hypothetical protein